MSNQNTIKWKERPHTITKDKSSNADAMYATANDVQAGPLQRCAYIVPYDPCADCDGAGCLVNGDCLKARHGDLHARSRRETGVGSMTPVLDSKERAYLAKYAQLRSRRWKGDCQNQFYAMM